MALGWATQEPPGMPTPYPKALYPATSLSRSGDSGDPGPLLQGSSQARLLTRLSSQVALGFCPHTFGHRKNTLDRKKGALPWWMSLTHCPCCHSPLLLETRMPKAPGRFRKVSFALHGGPGTPGQGTFERSHGASVFSFGC